MDEIFNDWVEAEDSAVANDRPGTTVMLTWTPIITRWHALVIFFLGARAGKLNIASIKVLSAKNGEALLLIKQQFEKETTDREFGEAMDRGRTMNVDARALSDNINDLPVVLGQDWVSRHTGADSLDYDSQEEYDRGVDPR